MEAKAQGGQGAGKWSPPPPAESKAEGAHSGENTEGTDLSVCRSGGCLCYSPFWPWVQEDTYPVGHQGTGPLGLRAKCLSNKSEPGGGGGSTCDLEATWGRGRGHQRIGPR